jgi:putative endonuclease
MELYYVYILRSKKDGKLYVGFSTDLKKRFKYHSEGRCVATRHRRPLALIYYEAYSNEHDARIREIFLKSGRGREVLTKQLKNTIKHAGVV